MTDRNVFVAAFLTAVLIVASAFALQQFFFFELAKSTIFVAIAVMVFYGDNRYSYMLGMVAPVFWYLADLLVGSFFTHFRVLVDYMSPGKSIPPLATPLQGLSYLTALVLIFVSWRAWKKEVPDKFIGKTFWTCCAVSLAYAVVLAVWYARTARA